jgi:hypothetical protein
VRLADGSSLRSNRSIKITCGELDDILEFNKSPDRHLDYEENTRHVTKGNSFPSSSLSVHQIVFEYYSRINTNRDVTCRSVLYIQAYLRRF